MFPYSMTSLTWLIEEAYLTQHRLEFPNLFRHASKLDKKPYQPTLLDSIPNTTYGYQSQMRRALITASFPEINLKQGIVLLYGANDQQRKKILFVPPRESGQLDDHPVLLYNGYIYCTQFGIDQQNSHTTVVDQRGMRMADRTGQRFGDYRLKGLNDFARG